MKITIDINKDGLTTEECQDLSECLEFFHTTDIISILEGAKHSFKIGKNNTKVEIKRNFINKERKNNDTTNGIL